MVKIGHAAIDENGQIAGGAAGDQTGSEIFIRDWYDFGQTQLIRPKEDHLRHFIAANMEAACANPHIGYDQRQRTTLYTELQQKAWNMNAVNKDCECDCSSIVSCCVNASGVTVSPHLYTGNLAQGLLNTGKFELITAKEYLRSPDLLRRGDILIKPNKHTVIVLTDAPAKQEPAKAQPEIQDALYHDATMAGTYTVTTALNLRRGAGTGYKITAVLPKGATVRCYGYFNKIGSVPWPLVTWDGKTGYCSSKYLKK